MAPFSSKIVYSVFGSTPSLTLPKIRRPKEVVRSRVGPGRCECFPPLWAAMPKWSVLFIHSMLYPTCNCRRGIFTTRKKRPKWLQCICMNTNRPTHSFHSAMPFPHSHSQPSISTGSHTRSPGCPHARRFLTASPSFPTASFLDGVTPTHLRPTATRLPTPISLLQLNAMPRRLREGKRGCVEFHSLYIVLTDICPTYITRTRT